MEKYLLPGRHNILFKAREGVKIVYKTATGYCEDNCDQAQEAQEQEDNVSFHTLAVYNSVASDIVPFNTEGYSVA